ncbi:MAG: DUF3524 domain-containing protein [Gammaproteobacteria bacterium]|jgi:glycosyltransferase involved in cell wall biosynthesis|nr:DUF3524 domain-containing protein [Gammaproteobacteria bacterium]MBT7370403.1 DUF3524 domain-containing protein [Gammaproteobacteria bacterium]
MPDLLILSAYDAQSHQLWRHALAAFLTDNQPEWTIRQVALSPRYFSWRSRGNSLTLALHPEIQKPPDLIIATSMTDLSALRGMNRHVAEVPAIVYFHENQFAYPDTHREGQLERRITSIYTALSADRCFFNSEFNRSTFLTGSDELLAKMPDEVPSGVVDTIRTESRVVPVALGKPLPAGARSERLRIVWNHRWEHDKGPEQLRDIVEALLTENVDFEMSLLGQQFRQTPEAMEEVASLLASAGRLRHKGFIDDRHQYFDQLSQHDIVLSTAQHEFQGLAVQEAMNCGCIPVVPDGLSYPEYVPRQYRFDTVNEAVSVVVRIARGERENLSLAAFSWAAIGPVWLAEIDLLLRQRKTA